MTGTNANKKAEAAARACGMSTEQWSAVRTQARAALTRGRRAQAETKLATWGEVAGQDALFAARRTRWGRKPSMISRSATTCPRTRSADGTTSAAPGQPAS